MMKGLMNALLMGALMALSVVNAIATPDPAPLSDVHRTSMDLYALKRLEDGGRFAVSVSREDDLLSDSGKVLATKMYDVVLMFDVTPKGEVTVNGVPVKMGLSNVVMNAGTIVGVTAEGRRTMSPQEVQKSFDVGVVAVQVMATSQKFVDPLSHQEVQRITIGERIYELNGNRVTQAGLREDSEDTVMGQIIDVYQNGTLVRQPACPMAVGSLVMGVKQYCVSKALKAFKKWWKHLPAASRAAFVAMVAALGCFTVGAAIMVVSMIHREARLDTEAEPAIVVKMNVDGKHGLYVKKAEDDDSEEEEDALPTYVPGYAPVATNDVSVISK